MSLLSCNKCSQVVLRSEGIFGLNLFVCEYCHELGHHTRLDQSKEYEFDKLHAIKLLESDLVKPLLDEHYDKFFHMETYIQDSLAGECECIRKVWDVDPNKIKSELLTKGTALNTKLFKALKKYIK